MRTRLPWGVGVALFLAAGCGTNQMRGGHVVPRGQEPPGRVLMRYEPVGCVDPAGQRSSAALGDLWLVRVEEGRDVLVSVTPGYDSVVIDNEFVAGGERVFQLSIEAGPGRDVLMDARLPVIGEGAGRLALARIWREEREGDSAVRAYFDRAVLVCRLDPAPVEGASLRRSDLRFTSPPEAGGGAGSAGHRARLSTEADW